MGLRPIVSDPTGERYDGVPTYRWGDAPPHLMTRRMLAAAGLRKNGQSPVAEMRRYVGGWQVAYLYDRNMAAPRRPWTSAKQAAVQAAADSKKWCRSCNRQLDYVPQDFTCERCRSGAEERTVMMTRLCIDYAGGTVDWDLADHGEDALRDAVDLVSRIEAGDDAEVTLPDRDGVKHIVNLAKVDRFDLSWEPSADQLPQPVGVL